MLMRFHNPQNFLWWAICNAGADYGQGGSNIPVFFGVAVYQSMLLRHLDELNSKRSISVKIIESVGPLYLVIAKFDNSQIISN